eukprot:1411068-Lingulodinium_polyedra.AAC.1
MRTHAKPCARTQATPRPKNASEFHRLLGRHLHIALQEDLRAHGREALRWVKLHGPDDACHP